MTTAPKRKVSETPESSFLRVLFRQLDERAVNYAVMRNYRNLPDSLSGSDLDLMVPPDPGQTVVLKAIFESAAEAGGAVIGVSSSPLFFKAFILGRGGGEEGTWWGLRVDVNLGYAYRGIALVDLDEIPRYQTRHGDIKVLQSGFSSVMGVLKEVLNHGNVTERYHEEALEQLRSDWPGTRSVLFRLGETGLEALRQLTVSPGSGQERRRLSRAVRRSILRRAVAEAPLATVGKMMRHQLSKLRRFMFPPGLVVAVMGVDGAGKSTLISAMKPALAEATHGAVTVKHLRPGLLPPLARFKGRRAYGTAAPAPHGAAPSGWFISFLRLVYLTTDYIIGHWLVVRPEIAKSPAVVVFDRYAYDMAIDPLRFRISLPSRFVRRFTRFAPRPDLVLCLHGDPEILNARKEEVDLPEVKRQSEALLDFAKSEPRAVLVHAGMTIQEVRDQALKEFINTAAAGVLARGASVG